MDLNILLSIKNTVLYTCQNLNDFLQHIHIIRGRRGSLNAYVPLNLVFPCTSNWKESDHPSQEWL